MYINKQKIRITILLLTILFFQFTGAIKIVSADDSPSDGITPETVAGSTPVTTETSIPDPSEKGIVSDNPNDMELPQSPVESIGTIVDEITGAGNEIIDNNGVPLPLASQQTAEILSGDPFFADPIDSTVARVFLKDCTGWILPAGFTSGTCNSSDTPVQNAINAASSGAIIYITPGHYAENVSIYTNNLALIGLGGDAIIDQLILFANLNDTTHNVYSPLVNLFHGGNIIDASNLLQPGGQIIIHSKNHHKKVSQSNAGNSSSTTTSNVDSIVVNGSEVVSFSCSKSFELILPSGTKVSSTNILCGYSGSLSSITLDTLPGTLNDQYHFLEGLSLVMRNAGNPVIALPGSSKLKIQFALPGNVDPSSLLILGWDQNLNNGTGDWVKMAMQENMVGLATTIANYPGYFILVTK